MSVVFHKMHGAGNDFVLLDLREQDYSLNPQRAENISNRQLGVGCDQILALYQPSRPEYSVRYEIWNSDGSAAQQCGNGARCIGLYLHLNGELEQATFTLESPSGPIQVKRCDDGQFEVTMGVPDFDPEHLPLDRDSIGDGSLLDSPWGPLEIRTVSMGNPHALVLTEAFEGNIEDSRIPEIGEFISRHVAFPQGCNAGFAQIESRSKIRLRVVERGAGETLACGSGACAAVAALRQAGRLDEVVDVLLPGGHLVIKWPGSDQKIRMKGPAEHVFKGKLSEGI